MKKWLGLLLALLIYFSVHEGTHALVASVYGEYETFRIRLIGPEVTSKTPTEERDGVQWAFISGEPQG